MDGVDLRLGDWRDVLADVECDALISDPPYSDRVHRAGALIEGDDDAERSAEIGYAAFSVADVHQLIFSWRDRVRGWMCFFTSHDLIPAYETAMGDAGRYVFPPIPCVMRGMSVRLQGDGPSSWTCYLVVGRPREKRFMSWGTLPGAYSGAPPSRGSTKIVSSIVMGQKPLWLMRDVVSDYSRPGDLVCDPFSGGATTAIACREIGRRFVGSEIDPVTHAKSLERLKYGDRRSEGQIDMFGGTQ